ncbi:MAG: cobalamin-dependent protein [Planctomycetaceae bacterium]
MATTKPALRILTAVPVCDGHDSAINTINLELVRAGVEVVYLGYHRTARDMVRAAIQEDVAAIGISSYNGGHVEFFAEVRDLLGKHAAAGIGLFGGGGGTITAADAKQMLRHGVDRIFFAGTPLDEIVSFVLGYAERAARLSRGRAAPSKAGRSDPCDFLDRLADLVPPPRKRRHRYHGVFAPNHKLRSAVTSLASGNVGKRRDAATGGHAVGGHAADGDATGDCCGSCDKPPSHDTSRIAWATLMARLGEEFPLECPGCGGDVRLIAFITEPGPIRKILTRLGEPLEPPPVSPARGPPADWGELVQVHDDRAIFQGRIDELPVIDIRSL